jgi:hypothetical protein
VVQFGSQIGKNKRLDRRISENRPRDAVALSETRKITLLGEKQPVDTAYRRYQTAYSEALYAVHGDTNSPTLRRVRALANRVVRAISTLPIPDQVGMS